MGHAGCSQLLALRSRRHFSFCSRALKVASLRSSAGAAAAWPPPGSGHPGCASASLQAPAGWLCWAPCHGGAPPLQCPTVGPHTVLPQRLRKCSGCLEVPQADVSISSSRGSLSCLTAPGRVQVDLDCCKLASALAAMAPQRSARKTARCVWADLKCRKLACASAAAVPAFSPSSVQMCCSLISSSCSVSSRLTLSTCSLNTCENQHTHVRVGGTNVNVRGQMLQRAAPFTVQPESKHASTSMHQASMTATPFQLQAQLL